MVSPQPFLIDGSPMATLYLLKRETPGATAPLGDRRQVREPPAAGDDRRTRNRSLRMSAASFHHDTFLGPGFLLRRLLRHSEADWSSICAKPHVALKLALQVAHSTSPVAHASRNGASSIPIRKAATVSKT
jgi:hypothetical protein